MTSAIHYRDQVTRAAKFLPALVLVIGFFVIHSAILLPAAPEGMTMADVPARIWPAHPMDKEKLLSADWRVFQGSVVPGTQSDGQLSDRFRLAGTFVPIDGGRRKAILDDMRQSYQGVVSEGNDFLGIRVESIYRERVLVRGPDGKTEMLSLSFSGSVANNSTATGGATNGVGALPSRAVAQGRLTSKRIGLNSWIFDRDELLDYYGELKERPRRLTAVFDSLKPLRDSSGGITGYYLELEGEKAFYDSVQLREGDVIRKVNSMDMTSMQRAIYFITEFVEDRANAFVIEIERNNEPMKLIYRVR